jgi:Putative DNA-binding domain
MSLSSDYVKTERSFHMLRKYSPFPNKDLDVLSADDLTILSVVKEGWYIEYKREAPNPKSLAKSIASFANTYGGWLFIGVAEKERADNTAGSCPGIARAEMDGLLQAIRQSAATLINPTPHFELKVVWGPNPTMGLSEESGVICIEVAQSSLAPHIHSNGCIYRRVSDSSEPKPENDRHQLDILWDRRKIVHEEYRQWISRKPQRAKTDEQQSYLRLLLDGDIYKKTGKSWNLSVRTIRETLNDRTSGIAIPLEAVYPSSIGTVARQISSLTNHEQFGFTFIVGRGLKSEVWIPINTYALTDSEALVTHLAKYSNFTRFHKKLIASNAKDIQILDLNAILMIAFAVSSQYLQLLRVCNIELEGLFAKVILSDVRNTIPFLDSKVVLDRIDKFGLPLCLIDEAIVPDGDNADSFLEISLGGESDDRLAPLHECAFCIFEMICRALGIQGVFAEQDVAESKDEVSNLIDELLDAWDRAKPKPAAKL